MSIAIASLNLLLGTVYTQYGTMTIIDMKRSWRSLGFSHFGAAWIAMAFTCGPHHLMHGVHVAFEGRSGGPMDLVAVLAGLPAGVAWFLLRVEAFRGGRGDRFIQGSPLWLLALPTVAAVYLTALVAGSIAHIGPHLDPSWSMIAPNVLLLVIYMTISYYLLRTQLGNRAPLGGWSVSGLSLCVIFFTCAVMHVVFGVYALTGSYGFDPHGLFIDWLGVPAGLYFLWVVQGLYRDAFSDWNRELPTMAQPVLVR